MAYVETFHIPLAGTAAAPPDVSVLLLPRSLLVFAEDAYCQCLHSIDEVRRAVAHTGASAHQSADHRQGRGRQPRYRYRGAHNVHVHIINCTTFWEIMRNSKTVQKKTAGCKTSQYQLYSEMCE